MLFVRLGDRGVPSDDLLRAEARFDNYCDCTGGVLDSIARCFSPFDRERVKDGNRSSGSVFCVVDQNRFLTETEALS